MAYQPSLSVRTYQLAYQLESTVFFSHNKTASAGFNTSRTDSLLGCQDLFVYSSPPVLAGWLWFGQVSASDGWNQR